MNLAEPEMPAPSEAFDTPPAELAGDAIAEAEWRRMVPMLRQRKVITEAERGPLISLCQQWSLYLQAIQQWSQLGMIVRTKTGYPMVNPYLGVANTALSLCLKHWAELGLTPSSRSRIKVLENPEAAVDPFAKHDVFVANPVSGFRVHRGGRADAAG